MATQSEIQLDELIQQSHLVLYSVYAVFPFQIFPDHLVIDHNKVTIEYRGLLKSENVHTILLEEIQSVELDFVWFLAGLTITTITGKDSCIIRQLRKNDAVRAKRIIAGLLIAKKEGIDLEEIEKKHLANKLEELGKQYS